MQRLQLAVWKQNLHTHAAALQDPVHGWPILLQSSRPHARPALDSSAALQGSVHIKSTG